MTSSASTLSEAMKHLTLLGTDPAAVQGLRVLLREGRRCGLDAVHIGSITLTSARHTRQATQQLEGPEDQQQTAEKKPGRRKSDARRKKDAEKYRSARMKKKLLAILPIVRQTMRTAQPSTLAEIEDADMPSPARQGTKRPAGTPPSRDIPHERLVAGQVRERCPSGPCRDALDRMCPDCSLTPSEELRDAIMKACSEDERKHSRTRGSVCAFVARVLASGPAPKEPDVKPLGQYIYFHGHDKAR